MNRKFDRTEKNICMQNMLLRVHQSLLSKTKNIIRIRPYTKVERAGKEDPERGILRIREVAKLLFHLSHLCELTVCGVDALQPRPPGM